MPGWIGLDYFEDLCGFNNNNLSVILQLGSKSYPIFEIKVARSGFELQTPCFPNQELDHNRSQYSVPGQAQSRDYHFYDPSAAERPESSLMS